MSTFRLIANADDFGIGRRVSDGIVSAHKEGIISSTTLMANMPAAEYAVGLLSEVPKLGVGVHLVLTCGKCAAPAPSVPDLVDADGNFLPADRQYRMLRSGRPGLVYQIRLEWAAQIERARSLGISITHCDSHHGVHKYPVCRAALIPLLNEYGIRCVRAGIRYCWPGQGILRALGHSVRHMPAAVVNRLNERAYRRAEIRFPDQYLNLQSYPCSEPDSAVRLAEALRHLPRGTTELAFHPGFDDPDTPDTKMYRQVRLTDYETITAAVVREALHQESITLVSYVQLAAEQHL